MDSQFNHAVFVIMKTAFSSLWLLFAAGPKITLTPRADYVGMICSHEMGKENEGSAVWRKN